MSYDVSPVTFFFSLFLVFGFTFSEGQKVPAVFVFGDSLVDVGNNNYLKLSLTKANFPHNGVDYPGKIPTGRFSNGKNSADFVAEKLGLPTPPPYLSLSKSNRNGAFLTGVNFASGGARIVDGMSGESISLTTQVEYYSGVFEALVQQLGSAGSQEHLSKTIFAIVIGGNDLLSYFRSGSDLPKKSTPQQYVEQMVVTLKGQLKRIYNLGARKFVISGVPVIGCCPSQRNQNKATGECNKEANYWALKYNEGLKAMLQGFKSELKDINYSYFDSYSVILNFIQKPADYGFTEVKAACCGLGNLNAQVPCVPISKYCPNRSDHVFWDFYHPTEASARILVEIIFNGSQQYVIPMNLKQLVAV